MQHKSSTNGRYALNIAKASVIAGLYTISTLIIQPLAYGPFQMRISEALTILPALTPAAIPGLFVGCVLSNAVGVATGANMLGVLDVIIGSSATLIAAVLSYILRNVKIKLCGFKIPLLSTIPPVIVNAVVIGAELTFVFKDPLWVSMMWVGLGQIVPCMILGSLIYIGAVKSKANRLLMV